MRSIASLALVFLVVSPLSAAAEDAVYVPAKDVARSLARGGVMIERPKVHVMGIHADRPGTIATQRDTAVLFVVEGQATIAAGGRTQALTKGDVMMIPGSTAASFSSVAAPISCYVVTVPAGVKNAQASLTFVGHEKVEPTLKKAGPIAEGPNFRVSGGYRTGPYAPEDYRPDVEVHETEGDLFYVIDGEATLVTGGTMIGGRTTGPGQIRGSKIDGGQTSRLTKGDVMWVPAGVAHWFPELPKPLSYLLVKVMDEPAPAAAQSYPPAFPRQNATKLIETDRIVVWDMVWPKGEPSPLHRHVHDQVGTYYQAGGRAITPLNGPPSQNTTPVGNISTTRKGTTHVEEGTTDPPLRAVFIELKNDGPSVSDTAPPAIAPRAGAKQVHTEDRVSVWDYTWSPRTGRITTRHERETVIVWLAPGTMRVSEDGGTAKELTVKAGTMWHRPNGTVVTQELVSGSPREIIFEFK